MKKLLFSLSGILLIAAACNTATNSTVKTTPTPTPESANTTSQQPTSHTFIEDKNGFHGSATLTGYMEIKKKVCNPGGLCGETVDYAFFNILNSSDDNIYKFINDRVGNSFVAPSAVGIGCYQKDKNRIYYVNDADSGSIEGTITNGNLNLLLNSSKDSPVKLQLEREIYTSGRGAPDCASHFRNFSVSK